MEKLYYTIGEVAAMLSEKVSLVRFWSTHFSRFVKPVRSGHGNRLYKAEDIEVLKEIHFLVKERGLSLEGAKKEMTASRSSVSRSVRAIDALKGIREQLVEIRKTL